MGTGKIVLVDTDILIKVFRGNASHKSHLDDLEGAIGVSIITVLELYQGINSRKKKYELEKQLKAYEILPITEAISTKTMLLMKKHFPERQISPPDCLIAATAMEHQIQLFTDNKEDFKFIAGLKLYQP